MSNTLEDTLSWFQTAIPEPDNKNIRSQFCAHLEEFNELLREVHTTDHSLLTLITAASNNLSDIQNCLKQMTPPDFSFPDRQATLDAICDGLVTGTGLAHMLGMDVINGLNEVNRSNFSKFDEDGKPIFSETGKIIKGKNYSPPNLDPYV